jgi:hypothetical protein
MSYIGKGIGFIGYKLWRLVGIVVILIIGVKDKELQGYIL